MQVTFKNCAPLTHCISEIHSTQLDKRKYQDIVMLMYT